MHIEKQAKEWLEKSLAELNSTLRVELLESGLVTLAQWNEAIAPKLSGIAQAIEGSAITARTYRLHESVVNLPQQPSTRLAQPDAHAWPKQVDYEGQRVEYVCCTTDLCQAFCGSQLCVEAAQPEARPTRELPDGSVIYTDDQPEAMDQRGSAPLGEHGMRRSADEATRAKLPASSTLADSHPIQPEAAPVAWYVKDYGITWRKGCEPPIPFPSIHEPTAKHPEPSNVTMRLYLAAPVAAQPMEPSKQFDAWLASELGSPTSFSLEDMRECWNAAIGMPGWHGMIFSQREGDELFKRGKAAGRAEVAARPTEPLVAPTGESRWLIERTYAKGKPAQRHEFWLGVVSGDIREDSFSFDREIWATDALQAARFSSKMIAEQLRYRHFHPEADIGVYEHLFQCDAAQPGAMALADWLEGELRACLSRNFTLELSRWKEIINALRGKP